MAKKKSINSRAYGNKKTGRKGRILKRVLLGLFFALLAVLLFFGIKFGLMVHKYEKEAERLVSEGGEAIFKANQTSVIYDCNGEVITELIGAHDSYYIGYSDIPYFVRAALITSEDRNFYSHSGIDYKAVARAFVVLIQNKGQVTQGGSTITQQLARNVFLSHKVSVERKIKEMFVAREIEKTYSKEKILEFYINNIYFGNGFYGIEAASRGYFSKSVTELSLAEIAFVCSIPNNPNLYDPYVNPEETTKRKNRILKQMYEQKDIDKEMYEKGLLDTVVLYPSENKKNNYVETYVRFCATEALMKNAGFEFQYDFADDNEQLEYMERYHSLYKDISEKLYTGGFQIYTSIDLDKQSLLQQSLDKYLSGYTGVNEEGIYEFQGSATCIDNDTGKVVAIVGGRTQEYRGYTLNRAYQSHRQPGSAIKPILDYIPAFERNVYPDSIMTDEKFEGGPVNFPEVYEGDITIRYAVEKSKNTIAWKLFDMIGANACISYLKRMNFSKIETSDYVPSMSIGGMTYGVSSLEVASAYTAVENDGMFRDPTCICKITDMEGREIIDNVEYETSRTTTIEVKQVYQTNAARMMTDVLKGVLTKGTGRNYNISEAICAAKTGTTNGNKDVWFVGYSRYYTTAVWSGYDMPKVIDDNYGTTCPGNIWREYMSRIHEGKEVKDFVPFVNHDGKLSNGKESEEESVTVEESGSEENQLYTEDINQSDNTDRVTSEPEGTNQSSEESTTNEESQSESDSSENTSDNTSGTTDNEETTTKGGEAYTKPNYNHTAPGGADGGVYQEYWG